MHEEVGNFFCDDDIAGEHIAASNSVSFAHTCIGGNSNVSGADDLSLMIPLMMPAIKQHLTI